MQSKRMVPNKESAAYIGITEQTLNVWRCEKRYPIPYIKVGSKVFYWQEDLDAFLESRTVREAI